MARHEGDEATSTGVETERGGEGNVVDQGLVGLELLDERDDLASNPFRLPQEITRPLRRLMVQRGDRTPPRRLDESIDAVVRPDEAIVGSGAEPERAPLEAVVLDTGPYRVAAGDDHAMPARCGRIGEDRRAGRSATQSRG